MTEVSLISFLSEVEHLTYAANGTEPALQSAGRPAPGVKVRINAPNADGVGEVEVAGLNTFVGYWDNQPATDAAFTTDGWVRTGDIGRLDGCGYLYILDRRKDVIISGGETIYSIEVESVLGQHPAVKECAVIGLTDPVWGERLHAVLVQEQSEGSRWQREPDVKEIWEFARNHLASYKIPKSYQWVAALPRTTAGKINKGALRTGA